MERERVEGEGRKLLALRGEREALAFQSNMSKSDKAAAIRALPTKLREEALAEASSLLARLSPGDSVGVEDLDAVLVLAATEGIVALLTESLESADPGSHGEHDLAFLEKRRAELAEEIAALESDLRPNLEGGRCWPNGRISIRPGTLEPFDSWSPSGAALRTWGLDAWLAELGEAPAPEEKRGPGRPPKARISAGLREGRP